MNDYRFGNYLYELRSQAGLTQRALAWKLQVSDKAVSKWETGRAKPTTDTLRKLALLYRVPIEKLLQMREEKGPMKIDKIVITGGPCAGKTTAMSWIRNEFIKRGYTVLFVPETATELITGGVAPWACTDGLEFQKCLALLQHKKEEIFTRAARNMPAEKVLIVCDRGLMDNKAYMTDLEFAAVMRELNGSEVELRDEYDAVFHLVTAAKGALEAYTLSNNKARTETPEQAAALDDALIAAWTGHPHLRVIDNSTGFEKKLERLLAEISAFLGEPQPCEIERKYLIRYPDVKKLEELPNCKRVEIIQTYLKSEPGTEVRVRQRGSDGHFIYFRTEKRRLTDVSRVEVEQRLTQDEYLTLLMDADPSAHPIRKTRYCLTENNMYFEIDVYPQWTKQAVMEVELREEGQAFELPKDIKVIREVTGEKRYSNSSMAREMPAED
ncbi:MAG: AAA family ATPase [Lachnospiraceae bacterium]|nr:AAA family ATPase [Lachnospiraceae bacterium]